MEVVELEDLGDEILSSVQVRAVGATSGVSLDVPAYHLIRFEKGRVRRYRNFASRDQALEAADRGSGPVS
jgi:ketosteroid isomerase-like protein